MTFEGATRITNNDNANMTVKYKYNKALPLGVFTVKDVPRLSQTPYKQITALDNMHKIDRDVTEWYNNLKFPMKQKAFRDSFFEYIGLEQVETSLLFDNLIINDPLADIGQINGRTIAEGLCELNATFGHCDRQGRFSYVSLDYMNIFPSNNTVPSDDIVPNIPIYMSNPNGIIEDINNLYIKASYEEYETQFIDRIMAIDDYGYQLANNDYGTNTYVLNNNYLLYGRDKDELIDIMNGFMSVISTISYRPAEISCKGLPYLELGDRVSLDVQNNNNVTIYILKRTLTGIQSLRDTYSADGEEYLINDLNSIQAKIDGLNRATDRLKIEVSQTSEGLKSKVSKGEVSTEISQEADEVRITGNRLIVESNNFNLDKNGNVALQGDLTIDDVIKMYSQITERYFEFAKYDYVGTEGLKFTLRDPVFEFLNTSPWATGRVTAPNYQWHFEEGIIVDGTKSRQVKTANYNNRLEYCYEMPTPYFGDIGEGITDNEGICYIFLDDIFAETIDTNCEYQVFLQSYGEGTVYVSERNSSYFIVKGTPNMKFAWELKAVQRDYEMYRLDEPTQDGKETVDYAQDSYDYLSSLLYDVEQESEVIIYE